MRNAGVVAEEAATLLYLTRYIAQRRVLQDFEQLRVRKGWKTGEQIYQNFSIGGSGQQKNRYITLP